MSMYGKQHELSDEYLVARGLLTHFLQVEGNHIRLWHPVELLVMHGVFGTQFLPCEWDVCYRHLGNQIMTVHALLVLANACNMLPSCPDLDVPGVFRQFADQHLRFDGHLQVLELDFGLMIGSSLSFTDSQLSHIRESWIHRQELLPFGKAWTLDGLVALDSLGLDCYEVPGEVVPASPFASPVDVTCPLSTLRRVVCLSSCGGFVLYCDWAVTVEDLLAVWGNAWSVDLAHTTPFGDLKLCANQLPVADCSSDVSVIVCFESGYFVVRPGVHSVSGGSLLPLHCHKPKPSSAFIHCEPAFVASSVDVPGTAMSVIQAVRRSHIDFHWDPVENVIKMTLRGSAWSTKVIAEFWMHVIPVFLPLTCSWSSLLVPVQFLWLRSVNASLTLACQLCCKSFVIHMVSLFP